MNTFENTILLVDDNISIYKSLSPLLLENGMYCLYAGNSEDAFRHYRTSSISLTLLDIRLGDENGLSVLEKLLEIDGSIPVIIITGFGTIETAVTSIKLGAVNYIQKPINFKNLLEIINMNLNRNTAGPASGDVSEAGFFSRNQKFASVIEKARTFAASDLPILIQGESGTGKEVLADFIHSKSPVSGNSPVKINCSAFNESLLENELFGHEKGAYTGASELFRGVFERADKSTLFLDEIGDMPLSLQAKILRVIQNGEIRRLGGKDDIKVDVRFIAATNKNLRQMIAGKNFREDLYYRLNTATIHLPPLRERIEDVEDLSNLFLRRKGSSKKLGKDVVLLFKTFSWPGNIRELENVINYAVIVSKEKEIQISDLPPYLNEVEDASSFNIKNRNEKEIIIKALESTGNHRTSAAALLGISRKTLYNKMKIYGIG